MPEPFSGLDDSGREVDPAAKAATEATMAHGAGRRGACNPEPEKRYVPGHEGRKDLTQCKEANRVDSSRRNGQQIEEQVANSEFDRLIVDLKRSLPPRRNQDITVTLWSGEPVRVVELAWNPSHQLTANSWPLDCTTTWWMFNERTHLKAI